ncbi:uncharacterized protein LOC124943278 [Impatiens glandulifera]|uniref:uncharacterized protein LOC124943278 n=1 Tax=Impatiens glandulifera TaxID=253017 RepID=UPI001FB09A8A|nr:uncharacterized protein LOC124943278 [Impatiens glandulifera]
MESAEPPSNTRDEDDSASSSDRTVSHNTEENESGKEKGPTEQKQSASIETDADDRGEENVPFDNDQKIAENIVPRIMEEIDLRAQAAAEVYSEWFGYRCNKFFKHMLPGLTDGQSFRRLKEIEEDVISLTNAKDPNEAMYRHAIVEPHARLQKLTVHIRKLSERYVAGTPKAKLQLLVLDILEIKKGEFIDEIERLEANRGDTSPLADPVINETDERTETPFTGPLETDQPGNSESAVTEEKVKFLIEEFVHTAVKPWKKKAKRVAVQAFKMVETARNDLGKANERLTEIEVNYRDNTVLYDAHLKRTEDLEGTTSKLVDDLERFQEKTDQRLTKVDEDLGRSSTDVGSTLDKVTDLEKKNASLEDRNTKLEADLKAVTEQVNELMKAKLNADKAVEEANAQAAKELQDALDDQNRTEKEAPRSDANFNDRLRLLTAKDPELAKSIAAREDKEAERLNNEKQRLAEYAKAHKKIDTPMTHRENSSTGDEANYEKWEMSNRMCLMIIKCGIPENDKEETYAILAFLITLKYKGNGNKREHILEMSHIVSRLKALKLDLSEDLLGHLILLSLPSHYNQFKVSYNCQKEKWSLNELISYCEKEEEMLKLDRTESAHIVTALKVNNLKIKNKEVVKSPYKKKQVISEGCLSHRLPIDVERFIYVGDEKTKLVEVKHLFYLPVDREDSQSEKSQSEFKGCARLEYPSPEIYPKYNQEQWKLKVCSTSSN